MLFESSLIAQDPSYGYPLGLANFSLECSGTGDTANIKIYYDKEYDTSNWVFRKYDSTTSLYTDISSIVTYSTGSI
jgi:hypothetical protein